MRATAKWLTGSFVVGLILPAALVQAAPQPVTTRIAIAYAGLGQNAAPQKRTQAEWLWMARQAMKAGNLDRAEQYLGEAERAPTPDPLFQRFQDSPAKAREDLKRMQQGGNPAPPSNRFSAQNALPNRGTPDTGNRFSADPSAGRNPLDPQASRYGAMDQPQDRTPNRLPPIGQPVGDSADNPAGGAQQLLRQARLLLAGGQAQQAAQKLQQAQQLNAQYGLQDDSPQRVQQLLEAHYQFTAGPKPGTDKASYEQGLAQFLMDQAAGLMAHREFDAAQRMAQQARQIPVQYGPFERKPDQLLESIAQARRAAGVPGAGGAEPVGPPSPHKQEALRLVAQARAALDAGDLPTAERLATQARDLRVPDTSFAAREERPWEVLLEVNEQKRRMGGVVQASTFGVQQAVGTENGNTPFPVQQGVYNPSQDRSRNVAAQSTTPAPVERGPAALSVQQSEGWKLFQAGMKALDNQDREEAMRQFRMAWQHEAELDPLTRQQLKDKLTLLQATAPSTASNVPQSPLEEISSQQQVLKQKLYREISTEQKAAEQQAARDPKGALNRLQKLRGRVNESQLDPQSQKQLLTLVDLSIRDLERFIDQNRSAIELDERNRSVEEGIELDRAQLLEVQDQVAEFVEQFNVLMDERRYPEAEIVAKKARELAPDLPVVQTMMWKSRFVRQIEASLVRQERKNEGFLGALDAVEDSSIPFDDRNPIDFGSRKRWDELTASRRQMLEQQERRMSAEEIEIQRRLKNKVNVKFEGSPLSDVLETLGAMAGVPVFIDPNGLRAEAITSDQPVTINITQEISLRSALNLILEPLRLSFVIEDEVLKVTSETARDTNTYAKVYNVADLVIPIPNFVPGYDVGLPGAIREAHAALGFGGAIRPVSGAPFTVAADDATGGGSQSASVLAQMRRSGMLSMAGARPSQPSGHGPGGLGGAAMADFDTLIELITSTIAPQSWDEVGGPGAIEPFPTNLSLVISQTQDVHEEIADLLDQLRRLQDLQITIEVRFITLNDNFFERIGIDFDFDIDDNSRLSTATPNFPDDTGPSITVGLDQTGAPTADLDLSFQQDSFGPAVPQFGGFDAATAANFGFAILSDIEVFFLLQAAQGDQRSNVLQAPKVTLFNGQQASVSDTSQRPFVTSIIPVVGDFAAAHQPVITVLSEGTSLSVQAVVSSDRRFVRLTLVPFFSQIGEVNTFTFDGKTTSNTGSNVLDPDGNPSGAVDNAETVTEGTTVQLPTFSFTTVSTTVSVPDGGTVLLGGIKRLQEGRNERGVPMLAKLPYVSRLFKNVGIGRTTQSLMMMVTPRIIIQEEEEAKLGLNTE